MIIDRWGRGDNQLRLTKSVTTRATCDFNICLEVSRKESKHNLKIQLEECGWSGAEKEHSLWGWYPGERQCGQGEE